MNRKKALNIIINQFKKADQYNQLRPGETNLAIHSFLSGMNAMMQLAEFREEHNQEFRAVLRELGDYFDQFEDSSTKTREVCYQISRKLLT